MDRIIPWNAYSENLKPKSMLKDHGKLKKLHQVETAGN
jgi:hypothetical protein